MPEYRMNIRTDFNASKTDNYVIVNMNGYPLTGCYKILPNAKRRLNEIKRFWGEAGRDATGVRLVAIHMTMETIEAI